MPDTPSYPVVSVLCITYKHEKFLAQAIESVLIQETDFAVEMVIGEDCSPDGTHQIALDYERRYPGRVRVLAHPQNIGIMPNVMATYAACRGEFIAFLEGDDYWTDPSKLQQQVDALRAAPDCAMCFHDAKLAFDGPPPVQGAPVLRAATFSEQFPNILPALDQKGVPVRYTQVDIAKLGWFMASASMLFRSRSLPRPLPAWVAGVFSGDYTLQLLSTRNGSALYLPRLMSVYRQHLGGVMYSLHNTLAQNARRIFENKHYCCDIGPGMASYFIPLLEHFYFERSEKLAADGNRMLQLYYYGKAVSLSPGRFLYHVKRITRGMLGGTHSANDAS